MARIRSVHPGLFTDEAFASVPMAGRVLFIGLWCEADDLGVFEWKPLTLKMRLFPGDAVDVAGLLAELTARDMIRPFTHDGREFGAVRNFGRYQRPKTPKAVHPCPAELSRFLARDGKGISGPLSHPRDLTSTERKRRERQHKRDEGRNRHGSTVTVSDNVTALPSQFPTLAEVSRQMEDGGGSSVAKATGASAPPEPSAIPAAPDWRTSLFRDGVAIVVNLTGKSQAGTRTLIGKWLKASRDDCRQVLRVIEDARETNPADPVAWIEGALRGPRKPATNDMAFVMARA